MAIQVLSDIKSPNDKTYIDTITATTPTTLTGLLKGTGSVVSAATPGTDYAAAAHKSTHSTSGADALTPADIGAATSGHGHALTDSTITGTLPISKGGTGETSAAAALAALGGTPITVGTSDLTAGTSALATGTIYLMYE